MATDPTGNIVFEVQDWRGRPVQLTQRVYRIHAAKRAAFAEYLEEAKLTIRDPDVVGDAGGGAVALFRFDLGKGKYAGLYLRVVVFYRGDPPTGRGASHRFARAVDTPTIIEQRYQWIAGQRLLLRAPREGG